MLFRSAGYTVITDGDDRAADLTIVGDSHDSVQCLLEAGKIADALTSLRAKFGLDAASVHESSIEAEDEL